MCRRKTARFGHEPFAHRCFGRGKAPPYILGILYIFILINVDIYKCDNLEVFKSHI